MHLTSLTSPGSRLRRGAALAVVPVALAVAACGSTPPASTDAYEVAGKAFDAPWDRVKVNVGLTATGTDAVTIPPEAIEVVVDSKAGKGSLHLALPIDALGEEGASLGALTGGSDTLDIDALFDGQGLYVKSPLAATLLPFLGTQGIQVPSGDLSGWLKLGTADEFKGLLGAVGSMPEASADPGELKDLDPAKLKEKLEAEGITVTYGGTEQRNGVDADHLVVNVDLEKLKASDLGKQLPADQLSGLSGAAASGTVSADVWLDRSNGRPVEVAIHASDGTEKADITVLIGDPGDVALDAPASFVEVPLAPMLLPLIEQFGGGLGNP